jgi:nuclear transport factor 2 (NTF2) superfamily protein
LPAIAVTGEHDQIAISARPTDASAFMLEAALRKVRLAEDAWNTRDSVRVAPADLADSRWRNRA